MLLVPWQVGLAVLLQSEVKGILLIIIEALICVHIGFQAVPQYCLHEGYEGYSICILTLRVNQVTTSIPTKSNSNHANSCVSTKSIRMEHVWNYLLVS